MATKMHPRITSTFDCKTVTTIPTSTTSTAEASRIITCHGKMKSIRFPPPSWKSRISNHLLLCILVLVPMSCSSSLTHDRMPNVTVAASAAKKMKTKHPLLKTGTKKEDGVAPGATSHLRVKLIERTLNKQILSSSSFDSQNVNEYKEDTTRDATWDQTKEDSSTGDNLRTYDLENNHPNHRNLGYAFNNKSSLQAALSNWFNNATAAKLKYGLINSWDVSRIKDMTNLLDCSFYSSVSNCKAFNENLSRWDVSRVTDMSNMFHNAKSFNQDLSSWNVSQVTGMNSMFYKASSFNQNISTWIVSKVINMVMMFLEASSFNQNLSSWDVSQLNDLSYMFAFASSFNENLSTWNISGVTFAEGMFFGASSFNQNLSNWDVSRITVMSSMFYHASFFNQKISNWNVSRVISMYGMFSGASLFNQNLSNWDVSRVREMREMFFDATSFGQILCWNVTGKGTTDMFTGTNGASVANCAPTKKPSRKPTPKPMRKATAKPTKRAPSRLPTSATFRKPSRKPSRKPTRKPSRKPTRKPA